MGLRLNNSYFKLSNGIFRSVEPVISSGVVLSYTISELLTTTGEGTWTKPAGITEIIVECWGGGGGGGSATVNDTGGGGGGGGGYARSTLIYSSAQQSISYVVGNGGPEQTNGGVSNWLLNPSSSLVVAQGGDPGFQGSDINNEALGGLGGGSFSANVGNITYIGGQGSNGWAISAFSVNTAFSAGGGAAGSTGPGGEAIGFSDPPIGGIGASEFGGNGATGTLANLNFTGLPGNNYGGGGSGGQKISGANKNGGTGAQGLIRVSYSIPPPLQTYTGSNAAYSIRQLISTATASMQVQRSSDNAVLDIGFQADGMLDTGSLLTFVGAGSGYVKFWYDQTGENHTFWVFNDAIISQWPVIVSSGSLVTTNGKPALRFNAGQTMIIANADQSYTTGGGEWFQFAVAQSADATTRLLTKIGNSVEIAQSMRRGTTALESIGYNTAGGTGTDSNGVSPGTAQFIAYAQRTTTNVEIYMNGTSNGATSVAGTPRTEAASTIVLGSFNPATLSFPWSGSVQEIIHYPQNSTTFGYRVGLTAQINSYYGTF